MLNRLKSTRNLTILLTTHYMEEADRLCDRIAIMDHGTLVALGTPGELKAGVPGTDAVQVQFTHDSQNWADRLRKLEGVSAVQSQTGGVYRLLTSNASRATMQLVEMAASEGEMLASLTVQNTTLDDVFVHYTGRQLRDEQVKPVNFMMPPRPGTQP
jgi:ABC-2 type transport system ATP-binding protein